jgi:hypothetical protein
LPVSSLNSRNAPKSEDFENTCKRFRAAGVLCYSKYAEEQNKKPNSFFVLGREDRTHKNEGVRWMNFGGKREDSLEENPHETVKIWVCGRG